MKQTLLPNTSPIAILEILGDGQIMSKGVVEEAVGVAVDSVNSEVAEADMEEEIEEEALFLVHVILVAGTVIQNAGPIRIIRVLFHMQYQCLITVRDNLEAEDSKVVEAEALMEEVAANNTT